MTTLRLLVAYGYFIAIATAGHDTKSSTMASGIHAPTQNPALFEALARLTDGDRCGASTRLSSPFWHWSPSPWIHSCAGSGGG